MWFLMPRKDSMNAAPRYTTQPASHARPYRPRIFWLARTLLLLGFFVLLMSSTLSTADRTGPGLWWLVIALVVAFTGLWISYLSMPAPLEPITEVPMRHYAWFMTLLIPGQFVLRWFDWDGPQLVILVALAVFAGWWASYVPVARRRMVCAQYEQASPGSEPVQDSNGEETRG